MEESADLDCQLAVRVELAPGVQPSKELQAQASQLGAAGGPGAARVLGAAHLLGVMCIGACMDALVIGNPRRASAAGAAGCAEWGVGLAAGLTGGE